jgi:hypothetical protein
MDQNVTTVIVNRKDNKLRKGGGYHLDLFVIAIQIFVVGLLGSIERRKNRIIFP